MITDQQLHAIATSASEVPGIRAVVLGGSRARGTHHEGSDVDLGLYYDKDDLDIEQLAAHAAVWNTSGPVEVTAPGSWGPWVDGGGWLTVNGTPVDWILRDIDRVQEQCDRARRASTPSTRNPGIRSDSLT